MFRPQPGQNLRIDNDLYTFLPHPASPAFPYGQEGRMAVVYKVERRNGVILEETDNYRAFKVFKHRYRSSQIEVKAQELQQFHTLPGLQVASRLVISPSKPQYQTLLAQFPDLAYATLMPWMPGETWGDIMLRKQPLNTAHVEHLAQRILYILAELERRSLAHCDLSATNVMIEWRAGSPHVALVDIEQLYAPHLSKPEELLVGSPGYMPKFDQDRLWGPLGDRFAGAILVSEILSWYHPEVVRYGNEQSYFSPDELHTESERYHLVRLALRQWSPILERLFQQAWHASSLENCPPLSLWAQALAGQHVDLQKSYPVQKPSNWSEPSRSRPSSSEDATKAREVTFHSAPSSSPIEDLRKEARQQIRNGHMEQALRQYRQFINSAIENGSKDIDIDALLSEYNSLIFHQIEAWGARFYRQYDPQHVRVRSFSQAQRLGYWLGGLSHQQLAFVVGGIALTALFIVGYIVPLARYSYWANISLGAVLLSFLLAAFSRPPLVTTLFGMAVFSGWLGVMLSPAPEGWEKPKLALPLLVALLGSWLASWAIQGLHLDIYKKRWAHMLWSVGSALVIGILIDEMAYSTLQKVLDISVLFLNFILGTLGWFAGYYLREIILAFRESFASRRA